MQGRCSLCKKDREIDDEFGVCSLCCDKSKFNVWEHFRDRKPVCHICRKMFKKDGNRWVGNCVHFRGKSIEW